VEAIGIAIAVVAVASAVTLPFLKALSSERRAGEQKARADSLDVNLTGLAAQLADSTKREQEQKQRADRLSAVHAKLLAEVALMPADGSYRRFVQIMSSASPEGSDGAGSVYQPTGARPGTDTDLLDPFADG
jgi:hypothetical protein